MIRWRDLYRVLCGRERTPERVRQQVESVSKFLLIDERQHSPGIGVAGFFSDRALQCHSCRRVFLGTYALEMCEAPEHGLVWAQFQRIARAECLTHTARQNAVGVCNSRHNLRHDIVHHIKSSLLGEGPVVGFSPEMSSRSTVHQMHREARPDADSAKAALEYIPCPEFLARYSHVDRSAGVL